MDLCNLHFLFMLHVDVSSLFSAEFKTPSVTSAAVITLPENEISIIPNVLEDSQNITFWQHIQVASYDIA